MPETPLPDVIDVESTVVDEPTVANLTPARIEHGSLIRPAASAAETVAVFREYVELGEKLLTPDDFQKIGDKNFRKKSAWRKLSTAFSVSCSIVEKAHTVDEIGRIVRSEFTIRATAPNGRYMEGYGACSVHDRCEDHGRYCKPDCKKQNHCGGLANGCDGFIHYSKPEHDIPATAETRAKNRAQADLFGMGEVSAEEVDGKDTGIRIATSEECLGIYEAMKVLHAAGGKPGRFPGSVLGRVDVYTEFEQDGEKFWDIHITSMEAANLVDELLNRAHGLQAAAAPQTDGTTGGLGEDSAGVPSGVGGEASEPGDAPSVSGDGGPHPVTPASSPAAPDEIEEAELVDESVAADNSWVLGQAPPDWVPEPTSTSVEPEATRAVPPASPEAPAPAQQGSTTSPSGDEGERGLAPDPDAQSTTVGAAPAQPAQAAPAVVPREPSSPGERAQLAQRFKLAFADEAEAERQRHMLIDFISVGRTRSSKELTSGEIRMAIRAARLIESGALAISTEDATEIRFPEPGDPPTLAVTNDEGGRASAFLHELAPFLGLAVVDSGASA